MRKTKIRDGNYVAELNLVVPGKDLKEIIRPRLYDTANFLDLEWECQTKEMADYYIYAIKLKGQKEDIELFGEFVDRIIFIDWSPPH